MKSKYALALTAILIMFYSQSTLAQYDNCRWDGTSPVCNGSCGAKETEITRSSTAPGGGGPPAYYGPKFGAACATGSKALCCPSAVKCRWDGTAPFCDGSCKSHEKKSTPPVGSSGGKACATGSKVYCCSSVASGESGLSNSDTTLKHRPAIFSRKEGYLDVIGIGMDDRYFISSWNAKTWSAWAPIGTGEYRSGPVIGRSVNRLRNNDQFSVFGRGKDDRFYELHWNGQSWSREVIEDGTFTSGPAYADGTRPTLFGVGKDKRIYYSERNSGKWRKWTPIGVGTFSSSPSSIKFSADQVNVFARGDDRAIYTSSRKGNDAWSAWSKIGNGTFLSAPTVVRMAPSRLDLFAVGDDRKMWQNTWTSKGWGGWFRMDNKSLLDSAPSAISTASNRIDVIAVGMDQKVYHNAWLGDHWTGFMQDLPSGKFK